MEEKSFQQTGFAEMRSRIVSLISHDFRTPLSAILSSAELLEVYGDQLSAEKRREHLCRIRQSVHQMTQLLEGIVLKFQTDENG
jgi:K+-sensing histidine kinase KdpD